jgi:hypothetical protein
MIVLLGSHARGDWVEDAETGTGAATICWWLSRAPFKLLEIEALG